MQLEFDKQKQEINIKDGVPNHVKLVLVLMFVNLFNMIIQLSIISFEKNELIYSIMVLVAVISCVAILFYFLKRSWKSTYQLNAIAGVETKKVFGKEHVFLKLLNGKKRSFPVLKSESELENLKKTLTSMGIKSI